MMVVESLADYNLYRRVRNWWPPDASTSAGTAMTSSPRPLSLLHRAGRLLVESGQSHALERIGVLRAMAECRMLWADLVLARAATDATAIQTWRYAVGFCRSQLGLVSHRSPAACASSRIAEGTPFW